MGSGWQHREWAAAVSVQCVSHMYAVMGSVSHHLLFHTCRYQSGGGESSPLVQSVEDHLSSAHLDHVTRALQAKEVETLAAKRQEELAEVKGQLEERLNACCGDDKVKEPIRQVCCHTHTHTQTHTTGQGSSLT